MGAPKGGRHNRLAGVEAATLPTTLPVKDTIFIEYGNEGYSGTIPTEFGLLTELTTLNLRENSLTGAVPTELGKLDQMKSTFWLDENSLSSTIPTELGNLDQMRSYFGVSKNSLSSAIPTELGKLDRLGSAFYLGSNLLSSAIPTELGKLGHMSETFYLGANSLSSAHYGTSRCLWPDEPGQTRCPDGSIQASSGFAQMDLDPGWCPGTPG